MHLSDDQIKQITDATTKGIKASLSELRVNPVQHFEDHGFVLRVRGGVKTFVKGFLLLMGGGMATLAGLAIKGWLAG